MAYNLDSKYTANLDQNVDTRDPKTTDLDSYTEQEEKIVTKKELFIDKRKWLSEGAQVRNAMSSSLFNDHYEDNKDDIITVKYLPLKVSTAKDVKQKEKVSEEEEEEVDEDEDDELKFDRIIEVSLIYSD